MHFANNEAMKDLYQCDPYGERSEKMIPNHRHTLGTILSGISYHTVLEVGCGDQGAYDALCEHIKPSCSRGPVYIGFNQNESLFSNVRASYEFHLAQGNPYIPSRFLERDIFSLEWRSCYFDLICVTEIEHYKKIKDKEDLIQMIEKAFKHGTSFILRVVLPEENGYKYDPQHFGPAEIFFEHTPLQSFFPLWVYKTIAATHGKKVELYEAPLFTHNGSEVRTNYLLFS